MNLAFKCFILNERLLIENTPRDKHKWFWISSIVFVSIGEQFNGMTTTACPFNNNCITELIVLKTQQHTVNNQISATNEISIVYLQCIWNSWSSRLWWRKCGHTYMRINAICSQLRFNCRASTFSEEEGKMVYK